MSRPFADVLRELDGGTTYEDLGSAVTEIVTAVLETRKAGELKLTLKIGPNGETSVKVASEIKTKVPELPRGTTIFYATTGGGLVRDDPRQEKLPLRQVAENISAPKAVNHV